MSELAADITYDNKHTLYAHNTGTVVIMQGLPGAGKSMMAAALWEVSTKCRAIVCANWYFPELGGGGNTRLIQGICQKRTGCASSSISIRCGSRRK